MKLLLAAFTLVISCAAGAGAQCTQVANSSPHKLDCLVITGAVAGGNGTAWGVWHSIKSAPVPVGFHLESLSFRLEGPKLVE
jgi:hypothetical protein